MKYLIIGAVFSMCLLSIKADKTLCIQCDSSQEKLCATNPDQIFAKDCKKEDSKCYSRVVDGKTERGCALDLDQNIVKNCNNDECMTCDFFPGCNNQIFPTHRLQCLQCVDTLNGTCATQSFMGRTVCPIYEKGDKCIIRKSNATNEFIRGCLSSYKDKCKDLKQCYTCEGHGCNFILGNDPNIPIASAGSVFVNIILMICVNVALIYS